MKILFYDATNYDKESFDRELGRYPGVEITYQEIDIALKTVSLARGYDAICAFVNSDLSAPVIDKLHEIGIKLILLRCAGFNNVALDKTKEYGITVLRVPGYSPEAVAEHAMTLALAVNRHLHKSYIKVRENNFSLVGLTGINFYQKTAGIIGTGKIGAAMCRICRGFGMRVIAYDMYPNKDLDFVEYMPLEEVLKQSDLLSLHCPLTEETHHLINKDTIAMMKEDVVLVNTSRGALVKTEDLIQGIRSGKFFGVGLDVYEEEGSNVFENREDELLEHSVTARLLSFPNVIVTSHQGFLTKEALTAISRITLQNALDYEKGEINGGNLVQ
ncbi:MAG: 2-hydroxyacid dehydrogenase [Bacteroidales bacterium]|nr:2-hydroxyacid dehydrogenase [Clostridium sp.]MCM1204555.1 2-hydroxyacid dehydrogenase [Bacteroidales bacterium]